VAERPAANASPLIFLSRAELLDLLKIEGKEIVVPIPVAEEIRRRGPDDLTAQALEKTTWLTIVEASPIPATLRAWDLGEGETSVLAWDSQSWDSSHHRRSCRPSMRRDLRNPGSRNTSF
jgi:predicted nucleic acid-binding protein